MTLTTDIANFAFNAGGVNTTGFKRNRIINGNMLIDQRNAGALINPAVANTFYVDRWYYNASQASKFSVGQNAGSVTPPTGYSTYLGFTSLSSYAVAAGECFYFSQRIEGLNIIDLAWGTASTLSVTLSFWVRSSLTGTQGGALANGANNRSYPFTFTISSANTWEYKTVTISGDTTGTWLTTNGIGLELRFNLGSGATFSGTAGAWSASNFVAPTGGVSVVGTSGATFYITGVQLEAGSIATPYERQIYSDQLSQCQRYYQTIYPGQVGWESFKLWDRAVPVTWFPMRSTPTSALFGTPTYNNVNSTALGPRSTNSGFIIFGMGGSDSVWYDKNVVFGTTSGFTLSAEI